MWLDSKMNSDNNNNSNNNNVKMGKWRFLAVLDILTGISTIVLNVVTLSTGLSYDWVDWTGIGIWAGFFFISVGLLTIQRSPKLKPVVISTISTAIILITLYTYNLVTLNLTYYCSYSFNSTTSTSTLNDESLCNWRVAADIIFVVLGSLAFIINVILSAI